MTRCCRASKRKRRWQHDRPVLRARAQRPDAQRAAPAHDRTTVGGTGAALGQGGLAGGPLPGWPAGTRTGRARQAPHRASSRRVATRCDQDARLLRLRRGADAVQGPCHGAGQRRRLARQGCSLQLPQALAKLDRYDLLILDDISYVRKDQAETSVLFELIAERYERRSLLITANQPFSGWDNVFPDPGMTVAAIDRLVHHSTIFELNVESYRRKIAESDQQT